MRKILKACEFNSDMQYYYMCANTLNHRNDKELATLYFKAMPKSNQKAMVRAMFTTWGAISEDCKLFFFDLI